MSERQRSRQVIVTGTIGNVLEWYDFAIYGYFALQIGQHFFPKESPLAQMQATAGDARVVGGFAPVLVDAR